MGITHKKLKKVSRLAAQVAGLKRYFTGIPCKHGHVGERMVNGGQCVPCLKASTKRLYKNNKELRRAKERRAYKRNPERIKAKAERWRKKTGYQWSRVYPEKRRAAENRRHKANPEIKRSKSRRFYARHPEVFKLGNQRRRARKLGANGKFTTSDIISLFKKQEGCCAGPTCEIVFNNGNYNVDHKTPLSRGGSNYPRNLQLLCAPCNGSKGTRTQREWHRSLKVPT